jgi:TolB-like protein
MKRVNISLSCLIFSLGVSGCAFFEYDTHPEKFSEHVQAKRDRAAMNASIGGTQNGNLNISAGTLAAQTLINKANGTIRKDAPLMVASFVDSENIASTSDFGRMLSQQFSTQFVNNGYNVVEVLLRDNIHISEKGGEFLLSRKAKDLSRQYDLHAAVVGTYVVGHDTVFVNSKVVDISTNTILAAYNFNIALEENVKRMLEKSSPISAL